MNRLDIKNKLLSLYQNGVNIWIENNQLRYKSVKGKFTQKDLEFLKENKEDIMAVLNSNCNFNVMSNDTLFPLKDIQSAYFLGGKSDFGDVSSHVYFEVIFPKLDTLLVEKIWNKLIRRHEALRTVINSWDTQKIIEPNSFYKVLINQNDEGCEATRKKLMNKTYDPYVWPLFDIEVTQDVSQSIMHLSFDFLILDWTSIWILLKEFENEYFNVSDNNCVENEVILRDIYQKNDMKKASSKYLSDQKYWIDKIEGLGDYPKLPMKMKDVKKEFDRKTFVVDEYSWKDIKQFFQKYGLTPNSVALTVFSCVINKWIDQKKFVINLTTMNRELRYENIEKVVGDFTSTNLLSIEINPLQSFIDNAKRIQKNLLQDLQHNYFTGVEMVREIRKSKPNSIFPIVFTSSLGNGDTNYKYMKLSNVGLSQSPQVFMDCQIMEFNESLYVNIDTRKGIFDELFIEIFKKDYKEFLENILKNVDTNRFLQNWYFKERNTDNFKMIFKNKNNNYNDSVNKRINNAPIVLSSELAKSITKQCMNILQVEQLSNNQNFYDYGADSLILARLTTLIIELCEEHGYKDMKFDDLLRAILAEPTIGRILLEINNKKLNKQKINIQEKNSIGRLSIFKEEGKILKVFFHAGLGTMNCLRYILAKLKKDDSDAIAGITIQNQEKYCQIEKSQLVKKISEQYAELIINSGYEEFHLIGYCSGGLIAVEVANILTMKGVNVNHVTLIDTSPSPLSEIDYVVSEMAFIQNHFITIKDVLPHIDYKKFNEIIRSMYSNINTDSEYNLLDFIAEQYNEENQLLSDLELFFKNNTFDDRFEQYAEIIDSKNKENRNISREFLISSYKTQMASWEGAHMTPTTYIGDVTYLKAENRGYGTLLPVKDNTGFWEKCCIGDFKEKTIPGNHYDCIENIENASYVAKIIKCNE
ncbi:condensation domain-containing protein [Staphylococcus aureus]|uniref:condensation domain-containing protein n=1 Tax=Staphylococcus aureus TaxID=1280 RepID=UPI0039174CF1